MWNHTDTPFNIKIVTGVGGYFPPVHEMTRKLKSQNEECWTLSPQVKNTHSAKYLKWGCTRHRCFTGILFLVYYEEIQRELKRILIHKCRCNERLKAKAEGSTRLAYTGLRGGLKHLFCRWCFEDDNTSTVATKESEIFRRISWCECSWARSDWVCWVLCSQRWDS
jgi:hypothetical protein